VLIFDYIETNKYSRPERPIIPWYIVLHYTNSPGARVKNIHDYFESLKDQKEIYASAHVVIDDNDTMFMIPETEMAYNCGAQKYKLSKDKLFGDAYPNAYTLSIELCHVDGSGQFSNGTLYQAKLLCARWCHQYKLDPITHIIRHYDITGKMCPKYFVDDINAFFRFKVSVDRIIREAIE